MKKILIAGSNGLVGRALAKYLKSKGYMVYTASRTNADFSIDLSDYLQYEKTFSDISFDVVVCTAVSYSDLLPDALQNVSISTNIFTYFQDKTQQRLFVSSFSALEENKHQSPYNFTKYLADKTIEMYDAHACVLRFGQIIDIKEGSRKAQRGFHYFVDAINENQSINVFTKHDAKRTYISVQNVCEAIEFAIINDIRGFHNIVIHPLLTLQELLKLLLDAKQDGYSGEINLIDKESISYHIPSSSEEFDSFVKDKSMELYLKQFIK